MLCAELGSRGGAFTLTLTAVMRDGAAARRLSATRERLKVLSSKLERRRLWTAVMSDAPPALDRQQSEARKFAHQPVEALLSSADILQRNLELLGWKQLFGITVNKKNPVNKWQGWGTLLNRRVEAKVSTVGGKEGRGLYAGRETDDFRGFKKDQVITMYSGQLMSRRQMEAVDDYDYMMRVTGSGQGTQTTVMFVDGKEFAKGITHTEMRDGELCYLPMPGDMARPRQGAGSLCNDSRGEANANARLDFKSLDRQGILPMIPVIVAKRDIAPSEEILFNYGTDKPHLEGPLPAALKRKWQDGTGTGASATDGAVVAAVAGAATEAAASASSSCLHVACAAEPAVGVDGDEECVYRSMRAPSAHAFAAAEQKVECLQDVELLAKMGELRVLGW